MERFFLWLVVNSGRLLLGTCDTILEAFIRDERRLAGARWALRWALSLGAVLGLLWAVGSVVRGIRNGY